MGRIRDMKTGEPVAEERIIREAPETMPAPVPAAVPDWRETPPPKRPVFPENRVIREGDEVGPRGPVLVKEHVALPADFEAGLHELELTLAGISDAAAKMADGVEQATVLIIGLRRRAQQDQERLQKLDAIEKALGGK